MVFFRNLVFFVAVLFQENVHEVSAFFLGKNTNDEVGFFVGFVGGGDDAVAARRKTVATHNLAHVDVLRGSGDRRVAVEETSTQVPSTFTFDLENKHHHHVFTV